ncbi:exodeoxyribonuclease VII large subunit [Roseomonas marmotae]|uniref:Exodeoxyribonuclease 7 large subunit n=1 Tax=Roseomonas marmotae TaxID=2768161 RepID=A0ABS3K7S6_9PROT|nr:exodeoxyribonuclease VII large subunit [Roseomonas marmotae]MBO1073529.1 exodeoxyribonuclease VII large subunit [Roseomonas marmotae]QTI80283.1 exodeoxyribonuclease VII large subunit [Roseomonas marmotae]
MDTAAEAPRTNAPEFTVSEISGAIKRTLEGEFGRVRVRGEITELKAYPSGHIYLALKDEGAKIRAIIWRFAVPRLTLKPENGVEVIATGKVSAYGERSDYQLIIDRLEYAGEGALLARVEALRKRLAAEGLFDESRRRPLPRLPRVIGVVSSEKGAVIQDIRTTIARRFPSHILLWPVPVQGQGAAEQIAAAIEGFSRLPPHIPRPDVVIVARGGGSLEDLMAFNEEIVVRAAANCPIPLISAVGHETDTTLIDLASDRRAPTPTAAAELAVPARVELMAALDQTSARLLSCGQASLNHARLRLSRVEARMPDLPGLVGAARQRLDDRAERLQMAPMALLARKRGTLDAIAPRLPHPRETLAGHRHSLSHLDTRARAALQRLTDQRHARLARIADPAAGMAARLREARLHLSGLGARLEGASYQGVLARGFALIRTAEGHPVTRAAGVAPGALLSITLQDGTLNATTTDGSAAPPGPAAPLAPKRTKPAPKPEQGSLL